MAVGAAESMKVHTDLVSTHTSASGFRTACGQAGCTDSSIPSRRQARCAHHLQPDPTHGIITFLNGSTKKTRFDIKR